MTISDKQRLLEVIRNVVNGFDGIRRELRSSGGNPVELEAASQALREIEYALMAEIAPPEPAVKA